MSQEARSKPEMSLESHHETLHGTEQHPEVGIVSIVKKLAADVAPIIGFWKGAKWPLTIIGAGILSAITGGLINLIRAWIGGGQ